MRIAPSERVVFENNPLAEVICQVRYERTDLTGDATAAAAGVLRGMGFPKTYSEEAAVVSVRVRRSDEGGDDVPQAEPLRILHFASEDSVLRVSLSSEFIALTCTKYVSWTDFKPRMLAVADQVGKLINAPPTSRIGLRYKDVIEREPLGIEGTPWRDLLSPFVLGPLAAAEFSADGVVPEKAVSSFAFQSTLQLEDCKLLLQGGLLQTVDGSRHAYLVDSDFFLDTEAPSNALAETSVLSNTLDRLHANAGALFGRTISRRLRDALKPKNEA